MTDYLKKMPFTIAFIDKRGNSYEDSSRDLNAYISRHPPMIKRLHQPKLAYQILRMAAHHSGMQVVRRPADNRLKRELVYVVRRKLFKTDEALWHFINDPANLNSVR